MLIRFAAADLPKILTRGDQVCIMWRATSFVVPSSMIQKRLQERGSLPLFDVAWNVFTPFEQNILHWSDGDASFSAFATPVVPKTGAVLLINSSLPIEKGRRYSYDSGIFRLDGVGTPDVFSLANTSSDDVTLGLAHGLSINGQNVPHPTAALSLGSRQQVLFTPDTQIRVCLTRQLSDGSIVPPINSGVTKVNIAQRGTAVLQYDPITNSFDQISFLT